MITTFKIFEENGEFDNYIGKFIVTTPELTYGYIRNEIYLCDRIYNINDNKVFVEFDVYEINTNYIITDIYSTKDKIDIDKLENVIFLTPDEFYNEYSELCEKFYINICKESKNEENQYWKLQMIKKCKTNLETIHELQHYVDSEKYNL